MAHLIQHEKALELRRSGKSIGEIASLLKVGKSSVSLWCKDVKLTQKQIENLDFKKQEASIRGLLRFQEKRRTERILRTARIHREGAKQVGKLNKRDLFILGLGLYWAEGYKKGNEELGFTNSDPVIIKIFLRWLNSTYEIFNNELVARVSVNQQHLHREVEILKYWSKETNIPLKQFTKTSFVQTASRREYTNDTQHFGTLRIKVRKGTNLRRKIMGSLSVLAKETI